MATDKLGPPEVRLIVPRQSAQAIQVAAARKGVQEICASEGWTLKVQSTRIHRAGTGRLLPMLSRIDARNLYVRIHRAPVAVLRWGDAWVRWDPSENLRDDCVMDLPTLCRYKAMVTNVRDANARKAWQADFNSWIAVVGCDDHRDPRCLPFNIFQSPAAALDLDTPEGQAAFKKAHRNPTRRQDRFERQWNAATALHGRDPCFVAGRELVTGHHWDVVASKDKTRIASLDSVWKVARLGYLNVYPDGCLRRGDQSREVWAAADSAAADIADNKAWAKRANVPL